MSTWISKVGAAGIAALLLSGCDPATGLPFADLGTLADGGGQQRLGAVTLAGGDVIVAAPKGYCIDKGSVRRAERAGFLVMARCDTLGVRGYFDAYDLAIISVTTAPQQPGAADPTPDAVARTEASAQVVSRRLNNGLSLVSLNGAVPALDGVSRIHWRGAFVVNGHLIGVSLYAPDKSRALKSDGAALLSDLARATRQASAPRATASSKKKAFKTVE